MVTSTYKACTPMVLPKHIVLEDIDQNVKDNLRVKLDSVYREKEITVVVAFKHNEDNVISLMGVAKRSWKQPTLAIDDALQNEMEYKGFTVPLANTTNPSARNNERFNNICEILHIPVTNLQMKETAETADDGYLWCNWVQKLPPPFDDPECMVSRDVILPQWMSARSIKEACKCIVETRKMVKLARENGRDYEPKGIIPPLELAQDLLAKNEESKNAMRITNNFYNIVKIKEKGKIDVTSNDDKDINDGETKKRRAEQEEHQTKMIRYKNHLDKFTDEDHQRRVRQYE